MRRALRLASLWALDYTEVPGLDDLAWPHGPIRDAETLLAEAFEAEGAAILVGGSTAGILASLLALCEAGTTVALGRTSHRSVYAALALGQLEPAFLTERTDAATGYSLGLGRRALEEIARLRPSVVVVTYPTYQGVAIDLRPLAQACHAVGALLVADAAHGAHFGLDSRLPPAALAAGADVAILGLHKSLGSLTQTAALVWSATVPGERLRAILRLLQSSSPSYPLMASVDAARAALQASGRARWRRALDRASVLARSLGEEHWCPPVPRDPTRVVWSRPGGDAADIAAALRHCGVESEYADAAACLLIAGPNLGVRDLPRVRAAIDATRQMPIARVGTTGAATSPRAGAALQRAMGMLAAMRSPSAECDLERATGRVAADFLVPYPPGVPAVLPGDRLDRAAVDALAANLLRGQEVQGVASGATIRVVQEGGATP